MSLDLDTSWKNIVKITLPIFMGYFPAGIAYGMLAANAGLPIWFTIIASFTVFSGTSQYAVIPLMASGASVLSIFLSTFMMSLRFIFYTLNMKAVFPENKWKKFVTTAYLTDENFALLSTYPEEFRKKVILKVGVTVVSYWTLGGIVGVFLGNMIPLIPHLDFALPCLFALLVYEQYKQQKQWKPMALATVAFLIAKQFADNSLLLISIVIAMVFVIALPQNLFFSAKVKSKARAIEEGGE